MRARILVRDTTRSVCPPPNQAVKIRSQDPEEGGAAYIPKRRHALTWTAVVWNRRQKEQVGLLVCGKHEDVLLPVWGSVSQPRLGNTRLGS